MVEAYIGGTGDAEKDKLLTDKMYKTQRFVWRSLWAILIIEIVTIALSLLITTLFGANPIVLISGIVVLVACVGAAIILVIWKFWKVGA